MKDQSEGEIARWHAIVPPNRIGRLVVQQDDDLIARFARRQHKLSLFDEVPDFSSVLTELAR